MSKIVLSSAALCSAAASHGRVRSAAETRPPGHAEEVAKIDISIPPSGAGPAGRLRHGRARGGVFMAKCAVCHGANGAGTPSGDRLIGGMGSLATANPVKTVSSYWPYATTLFDYIRRAMPLTTPRTLSDDEVYALSAYILSIDGIVKKDAVLDAKSLPKVKMPNRDGFTPFHRGE